jgi:hypothetical protein
MYNSVGWQELSVNDMRMKVLRGCDPSQQGQGWKRPTWQLLVFVSSTFTDTHRERDFLMKELFPELFDTARKHNIEVCFVDMRLVYRSIV